jgi:hypothetical protein
MGDLVKRLRGTALDKDKFPRMDSEKWFPVGLAKEAADRIEALEAALRNTGVCMSCVYGWPEPYGCTDCLNTGWEGGAPAGFIREERHALSGEKKDAENG